MPDLIMFDAVDTAQIPNGPVAVAGYVDGDFITAPELAQRFPNAHILSIATGPEHDADCLDVETGDADPADVPGWYERQRAGGAARPCLYADASAMQAGIVPLIRSGAIARPLVRLWSAHYAGEHICGPLTCGAVSIAMDGTQWTDRAMGRSLDQSLLLADFFGAAPASPAKAAVTRWLTAGDDSLAALASAHGTTPATILRLTAEHSPGAVFPANVAQLVDGLCTGTVSHAEPMPAGLALFLPG